MKIGGSLIYDFDLKVNVELLTKIANWYSTASKEFDHLVIVVGGGKMSRFLADQVGSMTTEPLQLHRIGMEVTQVNSQLLHAVLGGYDIFVPPTLGDAIEYLLAEQKVRMISGGLKVGWSTDMDTAVFADILGAKRFYKLSNVDSVYTEDPNNSIDAKPIKSISWLEYMKQFGIEQGATTHKPNAHLPIDALCTQFCARKGISAVFGGGDKLFKEESFQNILEAGTLIHP